MPTLFDPLTLRSLVLRNRLWIAAMCQYSCFEQDGMPQDWHLMHLGQFAAGGAGLVITEAAAVSPEGRISPTDAGLWNDAQATAWSPIVRMIQSQGAAAGVQLAHAGRKASTHPAWGTHGRGTLSAAEGGWVTVAPSPVAFTGYHEPIELDQAGVDQVVADFASAARRAVAAGFDVIEIHAAHGYLLHQFLSPLSNRRTDEYGGPLENRARLLLRVVGAVREAIGDRVLFVRFSGTDWAEESHGPSWDEIQTATVAGWAADAGADFFDISSGGILAGVQIPSEPGYQVHLASHVKEHADVLVNAVGLITTAEQADEIVRSGRADAVMIAREALRDPHAPLRWASELGVAVDYVPGQYQRAPYVSRVGSFG